MPTRKTGKWPDGYIRTDERGRETYYIAREVDGSRYEVSTRAHGIKEALAHLARFEADPDAYSPKGAPATVADDPVYLDDKLVKRLLDWSEEKGNTKEHRNGQKRYLAWWAKHLVGVDLRVLDLRRDVLPALDQAVGARHLRIAALKVLTSWLTRERYELATDPLAALKVPQVREVRDLGLRGVLERHAVGPGVDLPLGGDGVVGGLGHDRPRAVVGPDNSTGQEWE